MVFVIFYSILHWYKTEEMCNNIICENPFSVRQVLDQKRTHLMCDKAVDDCLNLKQSSLTLMLYLNESSVNVVFICNEMDILNTDLNDINFNGTNYEKDDPDTIFWPGILNLEHAKHFQ